MDDCRTIWPQVVLFGDSHFQHAFSANSPLASMLSDKLQRRCDVLVRGFSGYNSHMAKLALRSFVGDLDTKKIAAVVVLVGSNDACEPDSSALAVPLPAYSKNLEEIISLLTNHGISSDKIVLISPPPGDQPVWEKYLLSLSEPVTVSQNATVEKYAMACAMVAKKYNTKFVDLYGKVTAAPNWKEYFWDGVHFGHKGSQIVFDALWSVLEPLVEPCAILLPDWKDVDPGNPEEALGLSNTD